MQSSRPNFQFYAVLFFFRAPAGLSMLSGSSSNGTTVCSCIQHHPHHEDHWTWRFHGMAQRRKSNCNTTACVKECVQGTLELRLNCCWTWNASSILLEYGHIMVSMQSYKGMENFMYDPNQQCKIVSSELRDWTFQLRKLVPWHSREEACRSFVQCPCDHAIGQSAHNRTPLEQLTLVRLVVPKTHMAYGLSTLFNQLPVKQQRQRQQQQQQPKKQTNKQTQQQTLKA
eukprot:4344871-Amphidinium_carterae.1